VPFAIAIGTDQPVSEAPPIPVAARWPEMLPATWAESLKSGSLPPCGYRLTA